MNSKSASPLDHDEDVPDVLLRLRDHWWSPLDDVANYVPLREINQLNALGEAPIHVAARKATPEDLQWLIDHGANIEQRGDFEMTPLHYAYAGGDARKVSVLLAAGADPNARCDFGLRPEDGHPPLTDR